MEQSSEYKALRKGASILKDCVSPDDVVTPLYHNDLLTPDERSRANGAHLTQPQRMEEVYLALERRVKIKPAAFHKLIRILQKVSALRPVAMKLQQELWYAEDPTLPRPAEGVEGNPELVLQPSHIPRHVVAPQSSRYAYPHQGHDPFQQNLTVPKSSVSPFQVPSGHPSQEYGTHEKYEANVKSAAPIQDSQQDPTKSVMHLTRPPMPLSPTFLELSHSFSDVGMKGGMTPESSRKLEDLMREYNNQCEQLKNAKAEIVRLETYSCTVKGQLSREREEHDGREKQLSLSVNQLVAEIERMKLKSNNLQKENLTLRQTHSEQSRELKEVVSEKEKRVNELESENAEIAERERAAVKKCKLLEKSARVRNLSDIHYDTTLELDHAFQVVLNNKKVSEEFKKKVRVLKVEIEGRKNATWP